ncbi:MAG: GxxExxY protein [Planctomycetota bacterium]
MRENDVAKVVVDVAFQVHKQLGPGLLESVYQAIMVHELHKRGLHVEPEVPIPVYWDELKMDVGFRADLLVERCVIVELKSIESVAPVHKKILLTYLKVANMRLGLLINFGTELIKDGISRVVHQLEE